MTSSTDPAKNTLSGRGHKLWPRRLKRAFLVLSVVFALVLALAGSLSYRVYAAFTRTVPHPESATGLRTVDSTRTRSTIVVTAHPDATRAGADVLRRGGTAADAAIAVQMVLTLVEPQSSGIGGGGLLLYYDARRRRLHAYDGRETAPSAATPALFLDRDGDPLPFPAALVGGRAVGVPGLLKMLALVHRAHGKLAWGKLLDPAIGLSDAGFRVTPRLSALVDRDPALPALEPARGYFFRDDGEPLPPGQPRDNPELAAVLRTLQRDGAEAFSQGALANDIVRAVRQARQPSMSRLLWNMAVAELGMTPGGDAAREAAGALAVEDLASYRAVERVPVCRKYRRHRVCGFPPPSAGGIAVLQVLGFLERFDLSALEPMSPEAVHLLAEAQRLAAADRDQWIGDPDFVDVPVDGLLSSEYVGKRSWKIHRDRTLGQVEPGRPPGAKLGYAPASPPELPSTSHFTIVDADGSVASMTSSIEFGFGSHTMVRGFLLNNQLTDFSFRPLRDGKKIANSVEPNKRPMSSMSPTIVFEAASGKPILALGSPGGRRIPAYVAQTIVAVLDWGLSPQQAVSLPHVVNLNDDTELEDVGWADDNERDEVESALEELGHEISIGQQNSGLHVIQIQSDGIVPGIDPRREGAAEGD